MPVGVYEHTISSARDLFEARVERTAGCWVWPGTINANGYGSLKVGGRKGTRVYAHRLSYELHVGPISEGLELDHLCRNRACCNPEHLEPVTRAENVRRGVGPALLGAINGSKTHCKHGHPFDEENTRWRPTGGRACRACARNQKQREAVAA